MSNSLIIATQEELHLQPLEKMDPNNQRGKGKNSLVQAALPTVLAGMYKATRSKEGAERLMQSGPTSWLQRIFLDNAADVIDTVAHYAHNDKSTTAELMENAAATAYSLIQAPHQGKLDAEGLKNELSRHRHEILVYLPPELGLGALLNDTTIDDRTNKMEGPVSNLMHKIEDKFSGGGS